MTFRVLICGSRNWKDPAPVQDYVEGLFAMYHSLVIIEGCAIGADWVAHNIGVNVEGVTHEHYPADWDRHGRAAGPIRNQQMLDKGKPDLVIAFSDSIGESRGTKDMLQRANRAGVKTLLIAHGNNVL